MARKLISIQEAADLSQKSSQTIRRLIKNSKIKSKKQRTPQGFNYQVDKESLAKYFGIDLIEKKAEAMLKDEGIFDMGVEPDTIRGGKKRAKVIEEVLIPEEGVEEPVVRVSRKKKVADEGITIEETIDVEAEPEILEGKVEGATSSSVSSGGVSSAAAEQFTAVLAQMLKQHKEDKDRLFALLEQFQKRTLVLEERIKKLESPKRAWWKMW